MLKIHKIKNMKISIYFIFDNYNLFDQFITKLKMLSLNVQVGKNPL